MLSVGSARPRRIGGLIFCLMAASALGGACSKSGSYQVDWQFATNASEPATRTFQPGDCGRVGVGGIRITATSGASLDVRAVPCGPGFYEGSLDPGSWTLTLVALDAAGQVKETKPNTVNLTGAAGPVEIHTGEMAAAMPPVFLPPLPQCRDGVDNDRDGRVDLDDAACANDPDGPSECGATDGTSCYPNPPGGANSADAGPD
jgi:hypothetical protein